MAERLEAVLTLESSGFTNGVQRSISDSNKLQEAINGNNKALQVLKNNSSVSIKTNDALTQISKVKSKLSELTSKSFKTTIEAVDKTSLTISNFKDKLMNLKTLAAGIVLGFVGNSTIIAAARLEQEQIAMKHFIGYNNKGANQDTIQKMTDSFVGQLRTEANATPFSTNEILSGGRRAINITGGDTSKAMDLVKLAEDMAALNPGKTVMDSMEALADLKNGEFERMKEFGFKFNAEQFKGLVGKGEKDNLTDAENTKAYDLLVKNKLSPVFKGGAKELSGSTKGLWSTVTGNLESIGANVGKAFLPLVNSVLKPLADFLDKNSAKFEGFGNAIIKVGGYVRDFFKPIFQKFYDDVKPSLQSFWDTIQTFVIPVVQNLWDKVKSALPGVSKLFQGAFEIAATAIKVAISIFDKVAPAIWGMYHIISPVLDLVIWLFDKVASVIEKACGWLNTWNKTDAEEKQFGYAGSKVGVPTGKDNTPMGGHPANALGTSFYRGGLSYINEGYKGEIVNLPNGSKIIPHDISKEMAKSGGSNIIINMNGTVIREDADIDKLASALASKINEHAFNM